MSNNFNFIEVKSSSGKEYYVEGYVSTTEPDFVNDIVDELGQKSTFDQLNSKSITMDLDHDEWRDPVTGEVYDGKKNKIPVAKVVDQRLDEKGTWVKAKLNKNHPLFKDSILPSIKDGFLHGFSIAYNVIKSIPRKIGDIKYRVIQDLKIANIAITGNPINDGAQFNLTLKSLSKKMVEEEKLKEIQDSITELKSSTEALQKENAELKSENESLKGEVAELKGSMKKGYKSDEESEDEDKKKAEMKSMTESHKEAQAELKSMKEKLEETNKEMAELKSTFEKVRSTAVGGAELKSQKVVSQEIAEIDFKSLAARSY